MKAIAGYRKSGPNEIAASVNMVFFWVAILVAVFTGAANSQTLVNQPTNINANAVSCTIGTIAGGQTAVVSVTAIPSTAEAANSYSMTGTVQLGPGSTDTNIANNLFTVFIGAQ